VELQKGYFGDRLYLEDRQIAMTNVWLSKIAGFLTGQIAETDLLKAAEDVKAKKNAEEHCEAYYYAGAKRLMEGDNAAAAGLFEKCVATDVRNYLEYRAAAEDLRFLGGSNSP
jgi:lipoprotein NlpI